MIPVVHAHRIKTADKNAGNECLELNVCNILKNVMRSGISKSARPFATGLRPYGCSCTVTDCRRCLRSRRSSTSAPKPTSKTTNCVMPPIHGSDMSNEITRSLTMMMSPPAVTTARGHFTTHADDNQGNSDSGKPQSKVLHMSIALLRILWQELFASGITPSLGSACVYFIHLMPDLPSTMCPATL